MLPATLQIESYGKNSTLSHIRENLNSSGYALITRVQFRRSDCLKIKKMWPSTLANRKLNFENMPEACFSLSSQRATQSFELILIRIVIHSQSKRGVPSVWSAIRTRSELRPMAGDALGTTSTGGLIAISPTLVSVRLLVPQVIDGSGCHEQTTFRVILVQRNSTFA